MDKNEFNEAMVSIKAKHGEIMRLDEMSDSMAKVGKDIIVCPLPAFTQGEKEKWLIFESSNPNFITSVQSIYRHEIVRQKNALHKEIANLMSHALAFLPGGEKKADPDLHVVDGEKKDDKE